MSSNVSAALRLELAPSRQRCLWRWLTHLLVVASLPMLPSLGLAALVLVFLALSLYRTRNDQRIILLWRSDGLWTLYEQGGEVVMTLAGNPFVQPWLVILPLSPVDEGRTRHIAIFPDMLPVQVFRRLRVRLRSRCADLKVDETGSESR